MFNIALLRDWILFPAKNFTRVDYDPIQLTHNFSIPSLDQHSLGLMKMASLLPFLSNALQKRTWGACRRATSFRLTWLIILYHSWTPFVQMKLNLMSPKDLSPLPFSHLTQDKLNISVNDFLALSLFQQLILFKVVRVTLSYSLLCVAMQKETLDFYRIEGDWMSCGQGPDWHSSL